MSVPTMPMSVTSAALRGAPAHEAARAISGDDVRTSRPTAMRRRAQVVDEGAADAARHLAVDLGRVDAADVVGLEDAGVELQFGLPASRRCASSR